MQLTDTFFLCIKPSEWRMGSELGEVLLTKEQQMSVTDSHTKPMNSDVFSLTFFQLLYAAM